MQGRAVPCTGTSKILSQGKVTTHRDLSATQTLTPYMTMDFTESMCQWDQATNASGKSSYLIAISTSIRTMFSSMLLVSRITIAVPIAHVRSPTLTDISVSASLIIWGTAWMTNMNNFTEKKILRSTRLEVTSRLGTGVWKTETVSPKNAPRSVLANMIKSAKPKATLTLSSLKRRSDLTTDVTRSLLQSQSRTMKSWIMKKVTIMRTWNTTWSIILRKLRENLKSQLKKVLRKIECQEAHGMTCWWIDFKDL